MQQNSAEGALAAGLSGPIVDCSLSSCETVVKCRPGSLVGKDVVGGCGVAKAHSHLAQINLSVAVRDHGQVSTSQAVQMPPRTAVVRAEARGMSLAYSSVASEYAFQRISSRVPANARMENMVFAKARSAAS